MRLFCVVLCSLLPSLAAAQPVQVLHRFDPSPALPDGRLIQTPDGSFYGVLNGGVYRIAPGGQVTVAPGPASAAGALVRGSDGGLYGTTRYADGQLGSVFRLDPVTLATRTLHVLSGANERWPPLGGLVEVGGLLYGAASYVGGGGGSLFRLDPTSGAFRTLYIFPETAPPPSASMPNGPLALGPDDRLYGTTFFSNPGGHGAIYRYDPVSGAFAIVHQFTEAEGNAPVGPLALDVDGVFYGTAIGGGGPDIAGTIFRFDPVTNAVTVLYALNPANGTDGRNPGALAIGADGHLYGTTSYGSHIGDPPTLFRLRRLPGPTYAYDTLGPLEIPSTSAYPAPALTAGADGRLYGFQKSGGPAGSGTIFRFDLPPAGPPPGPVALAILHDFRPTTVYGPSTPVKAGDGFLYGTTLGGATMRGAVYRLNAATGAVTILGNLPGAFAGTPTVANSSLVLGVDGLLYGTSSSSTATTFENRVVRVDPTTGVITAAVVSDGPVPAFGYSLYSGLVRTPAGFLYGLRYMATGTQVFRFDTLANAVTEVAFTPLTNVTGLLAAPDGQLYAGTVRGFLIDGSGNYPTSLFDADLQRVNLATGAFESVAALARSVPSIDVGTPVPGPDGSVYIAAGDVVSPRVLRVQISTGAPTPVCTLGTSSLAPDLTASADGSVVGTTAFIGLPSLFRCHPQASQAAIEVLPPAIRNVSPLVSIDGAIYGASLGGAYPGGAIFRVAGTGTLPDLDSDGDSLPNTWETANGLDPFSSAGDNGGTGDPDHDGLTNAQELAAATHPRGSFRRYFAEGATGPFFQTAFDLLNPQEGAPAIVHLRWLPDNGPVVGRDVVVDARSRVRIDPATVPGLANASFSTIVESDVELGVDRLMRWDATGYGSHLETGVLAPATTWHFAEGSTSGDFALFYLLQNPQVTPVTATIRYLRPLGLPPIERQYTLPALSRTTIVVDALGPELASTDVSAVVTASAAIVAERAMYLSRPGQPFMAGHSSAGVTAPSSDWFFAEGATGDFFDLFLLLSNPGGSEAQVDVEYLLSGGTSLTKRYVVAANSRLTIYVDDEQLPAGSGQRPLANAAVSMQVHATNGVPVVAERTMWWPGPALTANFWYEAHNSPGATVTATRWAIGGGDLDRPHGADTYVLLANPSSVPARVRVSTYFGEGRTFPVERDYDLPPKSRTTIAAGDLQAVSAEHVGILVESLGVTPVPIVVERASYASPGGVLWSAGGAALASPVP